MGNITGDEPITATLNSEGYSYTGLTIRQQFAMSAMKGLLSNYFEHGMYGNHPSYPIVAYEAVKQADDLIKALNETPNPNKESEVSNA